MGQHMRIFEDEGSDAYLLVYEIFVIVLDVEFALHLLHLSTLLEDLPLHGEHLLAGNFTLAHQSNELASIFQFFAETSELLCALRISATGLADLADLTSTETHKWITVVGILAGFELRRVSWSGSSMTCETTYFEL